jgi:signal transduction histidine kinase
VKRFQTLRRWLLDVAVVALAGWQQLQIWTAANPGDRRAVAPLEVVFAAALLLRNRFKIASRAGAFAALGVWAGFTPHTHGSSASFFLGSMLAFWVAGSTSDWRVAAAGWASGMLLVGYAESVFPGGGFGEFLFTAVIQTGVWIAAAALAHRGREARVLEADLASARIEREERARQAVAAERRRIARELHDVIAHNLSVAIIQLTAAQPDNDDTDRRVGAAEVACRQALAEMRRLLGVLRVDEDEPQLSPAPGLASLDELVEATRHAGLELDVAIEGTPTRPPAAGVDLAAYRIVQEALTNALKHGGGASAHLAVRHRSDAIEIEVVNQRSHAPVATGNEGRGLVGMRERVALYGGNLDAGPDAKGGFQVVATLPLDAAPA